MKKRKKAEPKPVKVDWVVQHGNKGLDNNDIDNLTLVPRPEYGQTQVDKRITNK